MNNLLFSMVDLSNGIIGTLSALGIWYPILFNFFGVCAAATKVSEFQIKKRDNILIFAIVASLCWIAYFTLQGDFVSALGNLIVLSQALVFKQRGKHKWAHSIFWLFFFIIIQVGFSALSFKTVYDLFPIIGGVLGTFAYFVMKEKHYRYIVLFSMICWFFNSVTKGYLLALICDSTSVVSILIAIIRYEKLDKKNQKQKEKTEE